MANNPVEFKDKLLLELGGIRESLIHLKESVHNLKSDIKDLNETLSKRGEEIKDAFYIAETARSRAEEVADHLKILESSINKKLASYDELFDKKQQFKHKSNLVWAQAFITGASIALVILSQMGVI